MNDVLIDIGEDALFEHSWSSSCYAHTLWANVKWCERVRGWRWLQALIIVARIKRWSCLFLTLKLNCSMRSWDKHLCMLSRTLITSGMCLCAEEVIRFSFVTLTLWPTSITPPDRWLRERLLAGMRTSLPGCKSKRKVTLQWRDSNLLMEV